MQKTSIISKLKDTYFNRDLDVQAQVFNLLAFIGITAGSVMAIVVLALEDSIVNVIIDFIIAALSLVLLIVAEKKKNYHLCSWILIVVVFLILIPATFFYCGGYRSGANFIFLIAFVVTESLLRGHERAIALALEFATYFTCCIIVYIRPETATILSDESEYFIGTMMNSVATCIIIMIVLLVRTRIFRGRQIQIQELNHELTARNESLKQYDRMKSDFLSMVAHEINTPLAVIAASSNDTLDLLNEAPLNMDEIKNNQVVIEKRVRLIDKILLDLMDTVAIETGRLSLQRVPVNLKELVKDICDAHYGKQDAGGGRVLFEARADLLPVYADPARIEQVMLNLLSNAFRYSRSGAVEVKIGRADGSQTISVTDDGEGMDAVTAQNSLKQFSTTNAEHWRHGIGLYICRSIIIAHNGEISIESIKGRGTTVTVSLKE